LDHAPAALQAVNEACELSFAPDERQRVLPRYHGNAYSQRAENDFFREWNDWHRIFPKRRETEKIIFQNPKWTNFEFHIRTKLVVNGKPAPVLSE